MPGLRQLRHCRQQGLQLFIVTLRRRVELQVTIGLHPIDLHRERLQVAQVLQAHCLLAIRDGEPILQLRLEHPHGELLTVVAQHVHPLP